MRDRQFTQRLTAVDKEPGTRDRCGGDSAHGLVTGFRVAPVQRPDADGEDQVEGLLVRQQREVLDSDLPDAHPAGGDLGGGMASRLADRLRGPVDGQDVAGDQPSGNRSRGGSRTAADLENPLLRLQRKCRHDLGKAR